MEETKDFKEKTEVNNAEKEQNTEKEKTTVKDSKKVKTKRGKHKEKVTIGDIVFRTLILVIIFFIVVLAYTFYIKGSIY